MSEDDWGYEVARDAVATQIEGILNGMHGYWTAYVTSGHNEPNGYKQQSQLWEALSGTLQDKLLLLLGMPLDDDDVPPTRTPTEDEIADLATEIAEFVMDRGIAL